MSVLAGQAPGQPHFWLPHRAAQTLVLFVNVLTIIRTDQPGEPVLVTVMSSGFRSLAYVAAQGLICPRFGWHDREVSATVSHTAWLVRRALSLQALQLSARDGSRHPEEMR